MVREARIIPSELEVLEGDSDGRDLLLSERLGFSYASLQSIRQGDYDDRINRATQELSESGLNTEIKYSTLAALIFDDWDDCCNKIRRVSRIVTNRYRNERRMLEELTGLSITNIHLLRQEFGGYYGNLVEAKRVWSGFDTGHCDWLRSVNIPTEIDQNTSMLMGFYWGDGYIVETADNRITFRLLGSTKDFVLYRSVISPLVEQIHNIAQGVTTETKSSEMYGNVINTRHPVFGIGSKAITTWARDDLGLSENRTEINMPSIYLSDELKMAFLSGVIATKGSMSGRREIFIIDTDEIFIDGIRQLFTDCGYHPRINQRDRGEFEDGYQLAISPRDVRDLYEGDLLIHPDQNYERPAIESRKSEDRKLQILDLISKNEESKGIGLKAIEISEQLGMDKRGIFRYLSELRQDDQVDLKDHVYFSSVE